MPVTRRITLGMLAAAVLLGGPLAGRAEDLGDKIRHTFEPVSEVRHVADPFTDHHHSRGHRRVRRTRHISRRRHVVRRRRR
jgi:hypothetical protein